MHMRSLIDLINRHRHANWALIDQALVSGSNFVTGVLLARVLGPEGFGMFVLLQALMLYVNSFQGAMIFQPMMSAAPKLSGADRMHYLQGVFAVQIVLSCLLGFVVGIIALGAHAFGLEKLVGLDFYAVCALIAALVAFQFQDWQRRYYFIQENARAAFVNDAISYGGQVVLLGLASLYGRLNIGSAFSAIAATSLTAFVIGFLGNRMEPVFSHARSVLRDGWRTGRDYLVAWQLQWLGTQGVLLIGAGTVGAQAAGGVRAAQNIVGPINILFQAMENVIPVVAARRFGERGLPGLTRYIWRATVAGSALLLPILLMLAVFSVPLTHLLYGERYADSASLVIWQAVSFFIQFYYRQVIFFLRTVMATGIIIRSGGLMSLTALIVAVITVDDLHETGVMLSLLCGTVAGFLYALGAALRVHRKLAREQSNNAESKPLDIMQCGVKT